MAFPPDPRLPPPIAPDYRTHFVAFDGGETRKKWDCREIRQHLDSLYEAHSLDVNFRHSQQFQCGWGFDGKFRWRWELLIEPLAESNHVQFSEYLNRHRDDTFDEVRVKLNRVKEMYLNTEYWTYLQQPSLPLTDYDHLDQRHAAIYKNYGEYLAFNKTAEKAFSSADDRDAFYFLALITPAKDLKNFSPNAC